MVLGAMTPVYPYIVFQNLAVLEKQGTWVLLLDLGMLAVSHIYFGFIMFIFPSRLALDSGFFFSSFFFFSVK